MNGDAFQIRQLRVDRLYGIRHDGVSAQDLSRGVNIIHGANGRGKTTFGRAVQGMIWPRFLAEWRPTVSGSFSYGGARWTLDLEEGRMRYQREGKDSQPSALPEQGHRERYWLSLHELLDRDRGKTFAEQIRDLALGGQNVGDAARELGLATSSGRATGTTRRLADATERLAKVRREQDELRRRERGLKDLERKRDEAAEAARRADLIECVIEYTEARLAAEEARTALDELPGMLAKVREDDADRIEKLLKEENAALSRREDAATRRDAARDGLEQNRIARAGRPKFNLADLRDRQRIIADLESELRRNRQEIAKSEEGIAEAWRAIGVDGREENAGHPTAETLKAVDDLVVAREVLRQKEEALKAFERILGDESADDLALRHERVSDGLRTLGEWLREARSEDEQPRNVFALAAGAALVFALVGLVAAVVWHPAAILALAAGVVLAVIAAMARRSRTGSAQLHRERYGALDLDPPSAWSIPEVEKRHRELESKSARLALRLEKARRREASPVPQEEIEQELRSLEERAAAIADELGIEAPMTGAQLIIFARNLVAWQQCRRERAGLLAKRDQLQEQIAVELATFNEGVASFTLPPATNASAATGVVDTLQKAGSELEALDERLETAERDLKAADDAVKRSRDGVRDICERLSIEEEGAHGQAQDLCEQLPAFRQRERASAEKSAVAAQKRREVEAHPGFTPNLLEEDEATLGQRLQEAKEQAAELDRVAEEIWEIRRQVQEAQEEHDLERALAEHEEALEALRREYEAACAQSIGKLLADHVEEESRETQLPPVFHRARELFGAFTRNHYELRFDPQDASFRGFDTVRGRGFELDELSSGTRVQLLLAVRVAFVEQLEQGCKLPILLDEALANSDDLRAEAIIEAVLTLCRNGRQVFYFTAQDDEVLKWKRALAEHADVESTFIPLPGGDGAADVDEKALPAAPIIHSLPPLNGHSRGAYGRLLKVPRWTGWDEVSALHVWYLEPRLERLQPLLGKGFERWGQLASLQRNGAIELSGYDTTAIRPLSAKAKALTTWQELWRIGRGRKVDRDVLAASKAVTGNFIDAVTDLCLEVAGDGRRIVEELRRGAVSGFRSNKMEELQAFLLSERYIEEEETLSDDFIRIEILGRLKVELDTAGVTAEDLDAFFEDVRRGPSI